MKTRSTTIIALKHKGKMVVGGDGQVSLGQTIMKQTAKKVKRLYDNKIIVGIAGSAADGITLFGKLEDKLKEFNGNLTRAAVELAKDWRTDKILRRLEALIIAVDKEKIFIISGTGDIIEPDEGVAAIGSGGAYALAAATVLMKHSNLDAAEIVKESLKAAANICIYTNSNITLEELEC